MAKFVKILDELNGNSLLEAGGKGVNLGVLINAGLPVPPGFVVTAQAYRNHLEVSKLTNRIAKKLEGLTEQDITAISVASREISSWIEEVSMPMEIQDEARNFYQNLCRKMNINNLAVAVRSSATAEDLPTASFAGQQETFLGIYGQEAVLKYLKKCWASLWTPQAISYRISMGFEHLKVELAVVVQAMINAEAAGVMFTANPVTKKREEILISASYGLGETVVSGSVTPDTYILTKKGNLQEKILGSKELKIILTENGTVNEDVPISDRKAFCLGEEELSQLIKLASRVEDHYGSPQDTEWALADGKIFLLQARPITTMGVSEEELSVLGPNDSIIYQKKKPPFGLKNTMEHAPEPMTPLDFAYYCQGDSAFQRFLTVMGLKISQNPTQPVERPNGCVAIRLEQTRLSPAVIWKLPVYLYKKSKLEPKDLWQPVAEEMTHWLHKMEKAEEQSNDAVSSAQLLEQALDEFGILIEKRFLAVFMSTLLIDRRINKWLEKAIGKKDAADVKASLLRALPFRTALQNQAVAQLAKIAATVGKDSKEFQIELTKLLQEYGDRPALGMLPMLSIPTWKEKSEIVMGLVDTLLDDPASLNWTDAIKKQEFDYLEARQKVEKILGPSKRNKFRKYLEQVRNGIIVREESLFLIESLTACLRRMALRLGRLLVQKSVIQEAEDVFFLFIAELQSVAEGKIEARERIERRKKAYKKVYAAHEHGQHWMITTGSFPIFETKKKKGAETTGPNVLKGLAASRGVYEGTVCIVRGPSEFGKIKKGDIMVAPFTAPVWTPLFRVASAVVTEIGSPVSHAAIVAREYNIPAVVAVDQVTTLLKDGQKIRVDGTLGVVTVLN